jgi:hypothetical protein
MNVIDYIMITCNLKNGRLQITSDYMEKCNRLQLITITNYDDPMSGRDFCSLASHEPGFQSHRAYLGHVRPS